MSKQINSVGLQKHHHVGVVIKPQKLTVEFTLSLPEMPDEITLNGETFMRVKPFPDLRDWVPFKDCIITDCTVSRMGVNLSAVPAE